VRVPGRGVTGLARVGVLELGDLASKVLVSTVYTRESGNGDAENPKRNRAFPMKTDSKTAPYASRSSSSA
jgi:hypothetical protein